VELYLIFPIMLSWRDAQSKTKGQLYLFTFYVLYLYLFSVFSSSLSFFSFLFF